MRVPRYFHKLFHVDSAVAMTVSAAGSIAAALFAYWFLQSGSSQAPPAITVSPVQTVQQSVQVVALGSAPAGSGAAPPVASINENRYVNPAAIQAGDSLVLIVGSDGRLASELTATAARALAANAGAFTGEFVRDGFARAEDGDTSELVRIPRIERVPLIVLGRTHAAYAANDTLSAGLRQADVSLDLRVYKPIAGFATQRLHFASTGAGFSEREALSNAFDRLAPQLRTAVGR